MNTAAMNNQTTKVFVPASDDQMDRLAVSDLLVPYQAGGIILSQVFRECRSINPDGVAAGHPPQHPVQPPARR